MTSAGAGHHEGDAEQPTGDQVRDLLGQVGRARRTPPPEADAEAADHDDRHADLEQQRLAVGPRLGHVQPLHARLEPVGG